MCELFLFGVHALVAAFVHNACAVGQGDVFFRQAKRDQQIHAGHRRRARAGGDKLHILQLAAGIFHPVGESGANDDGGAVLVVMKHGNVHARFQAAFDFETFGRFDVFEVDAAEARLQRGDDIHYFIDVFLIKLEVERVNARELFEQNGFAFHYRLRSQGADVAKTQHSRAVGDNSDKVAACGVKRCSFRVSRNFFARGRNAGRIGEREVALRAKRLGRRDGDFARAARIHVVFESGLIKCVFFECHVRENS